MEFLLLGFFTSLSLILAIGAQNIFVIEQGLKKQYTFIVCFICSISDCFLIFIGIFLFNYFNQYFTLEIELFFNPSILNISDATTIGRADADSIIIDFLFLLIL